MFFPKDSISMQLPSLTKMLQLPASAMAHIQGSPDYPSITGTVRFYQAAIGVLVLVQVAGLPAADRACSQSFFAFHLHSGSRCSGTAADAFADVQTHFNPENCPHPAHAGDLLPLLSNHGYAFALFLTDRFSVDEIIGKTVVIHLNRDDFTTQPAGAAGTKIACGEIRRTEKSR